MQSQVFTWLVRLLVLFTVLPVHECAHGYVAARLGDDTARRQGRLTLNPFVHLDLFGSILLVLTGFGWAKPVQVNPRNFKHPKRDMAVTALAGPVSNILFALLFMVLYRVALGVADLPSMRYNIGWMELLLLILRIIITTNLYLAVFNLLPVPPLDGSKIFGAVLPDRYYFFMMRYERYVFLVLLLLLYLEILTLPLSLAADFLWKLLAWVTTPVSWLL